MHRVTRYRPLIWLTLSLLTLALLVPLVPYALIPGAGGVANPGTELWREVRQAVPGHTQVQGTDAATLISAGGEQWRQYRMEKLAPYSAVIRGRIRITAGRSGRLIQRYTVADRWIHWFMAAVFLVLMLSGLVLLYGRWVLIPWLGPEGFSATAQFCKSAHNLTGLLFPFAVILVFFAYLREALFKLKVDSAWFLSAGGYLGGKHPSSGKINAGQKAWYWTVVVGGVLLCVSGLALDFPNFVQSRELLRDAYQIHTLIAVFVIAFFFVHIYLGAIGMEGSLESMTRGYVDANWAKEQHDLWYEEVRDQLEGVPPDTGGIHAGGLASPRPDD
jgi:formate dehydrogenase subunit gamma